MFHNRIRIDVIILILLLHMVVLGASTLYYKSTVNTKTSINDLEWANADSKLAVTHEKRMGEITKMNYELEISMLREEIYILKNHFSRVRKVKVTFYSPELGGINCDSDPSKTATMQSPKIGLTCAISRNLIDSGWLGQKIYIQGIGIRIASDVMGKEVNGKIIHDQIDILCAAKDIRGEAKKLGNNTNILATII